MLQINYVWIPKLFCIKVNLPLFLKSYICFYLEDTEREEKTDLSSSSFLNAYNIQVCAR